MSTRAAGSAAPPLVARLQAPPHWRCIDFISDLHLQAGEEATFEAWLHFMQTTRADAVFILGDLFDAWIGDDALQGAASAADPGLGFEARCAQALAAASKRLAIYFLHGNRDFLLGPAFARASGMTLLDDPCVLDFSGQRWLLSHGDALCLQDHDYMVFRAQVRNTQWQQNFLDQPLAKRQALARSMREQSEAHQISDLANGMTLTDLDANASCEWLDLARAETLIHGHTHRPAEHALAPGLRRIVLSDWDLNARPPRAEVLRLHAHLSDQSTPVSVQRLPATRA